MKLSNKLKKAAIPVAFKLFERCFHGFDAIVLKADVGKEERKDGRREARAKKQEPRSKRQEPREKRQKKKQGSLTRCGDFRTWTRANR